MSDIFFIHYFAFLFVIKVRNFPPGLNFYALECVTNRRRNVFFFLSLLLVGAVSRVLLYETFYSGLTLKHFARDVKNCYIRARMNETNSEYWQRNKINRILNFRIKVCCGH